MSDDEADPELLELLRQRLGLSNKAGDEIPSNTEVLASAQHIYNNAIDVSIDMWGTKGAAAAIYQNMQARGYSSDAWNKIELHPKASEGFDEVGIVNFIFTMDLLNFSFWSDRSPEERYQVEYRERRWTGYSSLLACLRRALDDGVPITTPRFWTSVECTDLLLDNVFRSATAEKFPLLDQRLAILREAGRNLQDSFGEPEDDILGELDNEPLSQAVPPTISEPAANSDAADTSGHPLQLEVPQPENGHNASVIGTTEIDSSDQAENVPDNAMEVPSVDKTVAEEFNVNANPGAAVLQPTLTTTTPSVVQRSDHSVLRLIEQSKQSAGRLVNLLAKHFDCFRDESRFEGRKVRILKRAQILVADLWAAFGGKGCGEFHDIDHLTMFADYRVPQMLHSLGVLVYSPPLEGRIRRCEEVPAGHSWEVQLRGCSIWAVEMIRRAILQEQPQASVNAVLIDFYLYDLAKEKELAGEAPVPHHRTRSIWY